MEIIKGPAGGLYVADTGGVLLMHSFKIDWQPGVRIDYVTGSYGLQKMLSSVSLGRYNYRNLVAFSHTQSDGYHSRNKSKKYLFGGAGIFVYDHDVDAIPDCRDLDTDADGLADRVEGNDYNLNGLPDDNVTPTGIDTDGDGLDNLMIR